MASDTDLQALSCKAMIDVPRIRPVLEKIADKWTIMILIVLCPQPARFNEIKRRLDGTSHTSRSPMH
ncbi:winged helix-turn-helix transcriptional regulator [Sphingomonas sp. PL-96]|uniref:winged helix-turn-helix transcriptional regulator n=1 Tax=Sphingomonas sp. PL-96 TaxID=2887201 RepID=UPI001E4BC6EE|nr:winged helix-turn-helix transcriptional regulator [Sphingomonas sp. PL-96]MCC2976679.1 winged helix-turn-helix transcriptional regulator [Sphingomonas sp. PL-96]